MWTVPVYVYLVLIDQGSGACAGYFFCQGKGSMSSGGGDGTYSKLVLQSRKASYDFLVILT